MSSEEEVKDEPEQMFRHESYTDGNLIYIDVMTPVKISGSGKVSVEKDKPKKFIGKSQIEYMGKIMPYTFMIEGVDNIKQAIDQFDSSMDKALDRTKEFLEKTAKEEESKLIVPDEKPNIITT